MKAKVLLNKIIPNTWAKNIYDGGKTQHLGPVFNLKISVLNMRVAQKVE